MTKNNLTDWDEEEDLDEEDPEEDDLEEGGSLEENPTAVVVLTDQDGEEDDGEDMEECSECSADVDPGANFCPGCGAEFETEEGEDEEDDD